MLLSNILTRTMFHSLLSIYPLLNIDNTNKMNNNLVTRLRTLGVQRFSVLIKVRIVYVSKILKMGLLSPNGRKTSIHYITSLFYNR